MRTLFVLFCSVWHLGVYASPPGYPEKVLSLLKLPPESITRDKVGSVLGKSLQIEESKRGTKWLYTFDSCTLAVYWNREGVAAERFAFTCDANKRCMYDKGLEQKIKEGKMTVSQAVTLLGVPQEMVVKRGTQVMNYTFCSKRLRLFFRDRVLVDHSLIQFVKRK